MATCLSSLEKYVFRSYLPVLHTAHPSLLPLTCHAGPPLRRAYCSKAAQPLAAPTRLFTFPFTGLGWPPSTMDLFESSVPAPGSAGTPPARLSHCSHGLSQSQSLQRWARTARSWMVRVQISPYPRFNPLFPIILTDVPLTLLNTFSKLHL